MSDDSHPLLRIKLPDTVRLRIEKLLSVKEPDFQKLAEAAGFDPATDFSNDDLRGVDFGSSDLSNFRFGNADFADAELTDEKEELDNVLADLKELSKEYYRVIRETEEIREYSERYRSRVEDFLEAEFEEFSASRQAAVVAFDLVGYSDQSPELRSKLVTRMQKILINHLDTYMKQAEQKETPPNTMGDRFIQIFLKHMRQPGDDPDRHYDLFRAIDFCCSAMATLAEARISVRCAVSFGTVRAEYNTAENRIAYQGDPFIEAVRLQSSGNPGEILISRRLKLIVELRGKYVLAAREVTLTKGYRDTPELKGDHKIVCYSIKKLAGAAGSEFAIDSINSDLKGVDFGSSDFSNFLSEVPDFDSTNLTNAQKLEQAIAMLKAQKIQLDQRIREKSESLYYQELYHAQVHDFLISHFDGAQDIRHGTVAAIEFVGFSNLSADERSTLLSGMQKILAINLDKYMKRAEQKVNLPETHGDNFVQVFPETVREPGDDPDRYYDLFRAIDFCRSAMAALAEARISVRCGVSFGTVRAEYNAAEKRIAYQGDPFIEAVRLQSSANPGEILISRRLKLIVELRGKYVLAAREVTLTKGYRDSISGSELKTGDRVICYSIRLNESRHPAGGGGG